MNSRYLETSTSAADFAAWLHENGLAYLTVTVEARPRPSNPDPWACVSSLALRVQLANLADVERVVAALDLPAVAAETFDLRGDTHTLAKSAAWGFFASVEISHVQLGAE